MFSDFILQALSENKFGRIAGIKTEAIKFVSKRENDDHI